MPNSTSRSPTWNQVHDSTTAAFPAASWTKAISDMTRPMAREAMPKIAPPSLVRFPKNMMTKKLRMGSRGTSHMYSVMRPQLASSSPLGGSRRVRPRPSPFHKRHVFDIHRRSVAEDEDHDRKANADLGRGDCNDEEGEHLAGHSRLLQKCGEGHEVDVDRVEHQLDREQYEHGVRSGKDSVNADRKEQGGQDQEVVEGH